MDENERKSMGEKTGNITIRGYFYACHRSWDWPVGASIVGVLSLIYWIKPLLMQNKE